MEGTFFHLLAIGLILGFPFFRPDLAAAGATINVTTFMDELSVNGKCSLREAIRAANTDTAVDACPAGNGADTIILPAGTYSLTLNGRGENAALTGDLDILTNITINGAGSRSTFLDGNQVDRLFEIFGPADVTITGFVIENGNPGTSLGGPEVYGGGVSVFGSAHLHMGDVRLQNNTAYFGGGLVNNGGFVTLERVIVSTNNAPYVAGIYNSGDMTAAQITVSGNQAIYYGGGIYSSWLLTLTSSTVSGNRAGTNGGGMYIPSGTATIANSTVSGSQGWNGIWIYYQAEVNIFNSTIASNQGIGMVNSHLEGAVSPVWGPPITQGLGNIRLQNTIVVGSSVANCARSINSPPFESLGSNLESSDSCGFGQPSDIVNTDPFLRPLSANGGPTLTHALKGNSPAIDAGAACSAADQRGFPRPVDGDGDGLPICDIGAYEYQPYYWLYAPIVVR